jgi:protein MAK16
MAPKRARREETRERKALAAARLEKQIEKELVNRLKSGNYTEDMLNVNEDIWRKVLDQKARAERGEEEIEEEEGGEEGEEEVEFVTDDEQLLSGEDEFDDWLGNGDEVEAEEEESEDEEEEEKEEQVELGGKRKSVVNGNAGRRKIARVEIEYEEEQEDAPIRERITAG